MHRVSGYPHHMKNMYKFLRTDANKRNLPCEHETNDGAGDDGGDGLNDTEILSNLDQTGHRRVETYAPRVIPARPKIFWGLPERPVVNTPVLFSSLSKNSMS